MLLGFAPPPGRFDQVDSAASAFSVSAGIGIFLLRHSDYALGTLLKRVRWCCPRRRRTRRVVIRSIIGSGLDEAS